MISMQGVPSSLILRNESWVRKQAQSFMRRMPSNIEKADLIQVGLIGVAQASLAFVWEGDRETEEAKEAFVRYARMRVKGAMLDELRQMDHLGRAQRRKVKVIQVATERWRSSHGLDPTAAELSDSCGMSTEEIFELRQAASAGQTTSLSEDPESDDMHAPPHEPATEKDEVEARVDTGMLMRRLEKFFATLPERERQVIDSYLGIGMTPIELAQSMNISSSRVSQLFKSACERIGIHLGHQPQRSTDRAAPGSAAPLEDLIARREAELARAGTGRAWGELVEEVLAPPHDETDAASADGKPLTITSTTRWG
ncbi:MAG TPA: sigma-70 family RNA polymerase sigma factor [Burkholderiaceae bacterium]|nr:sigma-70 family RNA polymerase sigma factor [Burkholderiaceae bacterium]